MISTELLRRYPFFEGFTDRHLRTIARLSDEVRIEPHTILFRPDDRPNSFLILTKGQISLFLCVPDRLAEPPTPGAQLIGDIPGERITVESVMMAGSVLCWSALVPPHETTCGAVTTTECELIRIEAVELEAIFEEDPSFGYLMMKKLAIVIHERLHSRRLEDLWSLSSP